ncbi:TetR family transcriptional regulator [Streptomyces sp. NPDC005236]|uniref:TetR/AcrR family transcriptional regulator n=1 Tax=Streptomyces sp. NPDC005236 TaxID=3157028 RepID=UPI0033B139A7
MNDQEPPGEAVRKHRRDPEGHRAAILEAARQAFAERGYARATVRDIARRAGVTHGLITRQFSSKERLFLAAVPGNRDLEQVAAGDPATLPERIARGFVQRMETDAVNDPLVALLRSAASDEQAATHLLAAMQERSIAVYRTVLSPGGSAAPGDDLDTRVALLGSQLIGVTFSRYIARTEPLASMPSEQLTEHLTRTLRHILFD